MLVVSDTEPIIALFNVGRVDLLCDLFGSVMIPEAVFDELTRDPRFAEQAEMIKSSSFIAVSQVSDRSEVDALIDREGLDLGESEAIILYREKQAGTLLIDERNGRAVAERMGIEIMGAVGVIKRAYDVQIMSRDDVRDCADALRRSKSRIGEAIFNAAFGHILAEELGNTSGR